jgi:preprotein translocase subunit SecY
MLSGFQNASRVPELRRRVIFALGMLAVYRFGVHVPTPGIDRAAMAAFFDQQRNTLFGFLNLFSGGALEQFSVFSLGIMPYISASIILQLLTVVFPYLERLSKVGEVGRRKPCGFPFVVLCEDGIPDRITGRSAPNSNHDYEDRRVRILEYPASF